MCLQRTLREGQAQCKVAFAKDPPFGNHVIDDSYGWLFTYFLTYCTDSSSHLPSTLKLLQRSPLSAPEVLELAR